MVSAPERSIPGALAEIANVATPVFGRRVDFKKNAIDLPADDLLARKGTGASGVIGGLARQFQAFRQGKCGRGRWVFPKHPPRFRSEKRLGGGGGGGGGTKKKKIGVADAILLDRVLQGV